MGNNDDEIAGARCSFCGVQTLSSEGAKLVKGIEGYICTKCIKRAKSILHLCPIGGVYRLR